LEITGCGRSQLVAAGHNW